MVPNSDPADSPRGVAARCGFVAVIGAPNAGKSTLVNALVGAKVSIVTRKVQTTRAPVRGVLTEGTSQLVFTDTPGIFEPRRRLDRAMVEAAWAGAVDADIVLALVDAAQGRTEEVDRILSGLPGVKGGKVLVLNKIDRVKKPELLALADELAPRAGFTDVFMISALTGDGLADLKQHLLRIAPEGPWHFPADELSDLSPRLLAAEVTREKIYERLHEELPYASTVETTGWEERKDGSVRIEQTIYVERDSQKAIVIGAGGQTIKHISMEARKETAALLERPVHLFLFVKVRPRWGEDPERYREMGLEYPKD